MKKIFILLLVVIGIALLILISDPGKSLTLSGWVGAVVENTATPSATVQPTETSTPSQSPSPTLTSTPTEPPPTSTPTLTPTPTWVFHEAGQLTVPILLYHHVNGHTNSDRYQVSIEDFEAQMKTLFDLGYKTIPVSEFLDVLLSGGELPPKSVIITFDDGNRKLSGNYTKPQLLELYWNLIRRGWKPLKF